MKSLSNSKNPKNSKIIGLNIEASLGGKFEPITPTVRVMVKDGTITVTRKDKGIRFIIDVKSGGEVTKHIHESWEKIGKSPSPKKVGSSYGKA